MFFLINDLAKGGAENQFIKLACDLKSKNYIVNVVSLGTSNDFEPILKEHNLSVRCIKFNFGFGLIPLAREISRSKPDVMISFMFASNIIARVINIFFKFDLITSVRAGKISFRYKVLSRLTYHEDKFSVFNSHSALEHFNNLTLTKPDKSVVINNAIKIPPPKNARYDDNRPFTLVSIAHFREKEKDYETLFKALKIVRESGLNFQIFIIGKTFDLKWPFQRIDEFKLKKQVKILNFVSDPSVWLEKADALVLSTFGESSPNALLEGMAHSLPIIASNVPGCSSLVRDSNSGFLVNPEDPYDMAMCILNLVKAPRLEIEKLGIKGYEYVLKNHNGKDVFEKWEQLVNN